jgi:hypothetical protein
MTVSKNTKGTRFPRICLRIGDFLFVKESTLAYCVIQDKWLTRTHFVTSGGSGIPVCFEVIARFTGKLPSQAVAGQWRDSEKG